MLWLLILKTESTHFNILVDLKGYMVKHYYIIETLLNHGRIA